MAYPPDLLLIVRQVISVAGTVENLEKVGETVYKSFDLTDFSLSTDLDNIADAPTRTEVSRLLGTAYENHAGTDIRGAVAECVFLQLLAEKHGPSLACPPEQDKKYGDISPVCHCCANKEVDIFLTFKIRTQIGVECKASAKNFIYNESRYGRLDTYCYCLTQVRDRYAPSELRLYMASLDPEGMYDINGLLNRLARALAFVFDRVYDIGSLDSLP